MFICDICGKAFNRSDYVESHKKQVHTDHAPQQLNLSSTGVTFDVSEISEDNIHGKTKAKKAKKKRKKKTSPEDENLNAVPILMSMAEQAAKPKTLSLLKEATTLMETDLLPQEEVTEDLPSPSNLGNEIINLIDESSEEDAPFTDEDTGSDRLEFFSDSEFQEWKKGIVWPSFNLHLFMVAWKKGFCFYSNLFEPFFAIELSRLAVTDVTFLL